MGVPLKDTASSERKSFSPHNCHLCYKIWWETMHYTIKTSLSNEYFLKVEELFPAQHLRQQTGGALVFLQEAPNLAK